MSRDPNKISEVNKFKREVIRQLYSCPDIIEMLDCDQIDPDQPDTAEWVAIFPYAKLPGTQEEVGTFICVTCNIIEPLDENNLFVSLGLNITIICAQEKMRVPKHKGTRCDIIAGDIAELLNWNNQFGYTIRLVGDNENILNSYYCARSMAFEVLRRNNLYCGRKKY